MNALIRKRRTVATKEQVIKRLKPVLDIADQIEKLTRKADGMLSDLIEDISWSTGDCVIGEKEEFDPDDYVYNVICQVHEEGIFKQNINGSDTDEPCLAWLSQLIQELKSNGVSRDPV